MNPNSPEFWPPVMDRDRCIATADQMAAAWREWDKRSSLSLAARIERAGAEAERDGPWLFHRLADGMLQRARRAGFIRYDGKRWHETRPE